MVYTVVQEPPCGFSISYASMFYQTFFIYLETVSYFLAQARLELIELSLALYTQVLEFKEHSTVPSQFLLYLLHVAGREGKAEPGEPEGITSEGKPANKQVTSTFIYLLQLVT